MGKVTLKRIRHEVCGECLCLENGIVKVIASLEFGPRILSYGYAGEKNVFYEDRSGDVMATASCPEMDEYYFKGARFRVYGGHRVWASPQKMPETFYPDNDPVEYSEITNGVRLTAPVQIKNEIKISLEIVLEEDSTRVYVSNQIENCGIKDKTFAVWGVTAMKMGGFQVIPQPDRKISGISNRRITLCAFTDMADKRVKWGKQNIILTPDSRAADYDEFKFGINNEYGFGYYVLGETVFIKRYNHVINGNYPDCDTSYEAYANNITSEMETMGELKTLKCGERAEHRETWELMQLENPIATKEDIEMFAEEFTEKLKRKEGK